MIDAIPTIGNIQRRNLLLLAMASVAMLAFRSPAASLSCLLAGAVVMGNLFVLSVLGRATLAAIAGTGGSGSALAVAVFPLKLLIVVGLVYLLFERVGVDGIGFMTGLMTQFVAIFLETGRVRLMARRRQNEAS